MVCKFKRESQSANQDCLRNMNHMQYTSMVTYILHIKGLTLGCGSVRYRWNENVSLFQHGCKWLELSNGCL